MLTCNVVIWTVWLWDLSNVEKGMQHYALYWENLYDRVEPNCVTLRGHFMQCIVQMEQWLQRVCWSWTTCIKLVVPYVSLWAVGIFFEFTVFKRNSKISRSFCGQREYSAWKEYCSRLQQKPPVFFSWQEYWEFFLYSVNWTNNYFLEKFIKYFFSKKLRRKPLETTWVNFDLEAPTHLRHGLPQPKFGHPSNTALKNPNSKKSSLLDNMLEVDKNQIDTHI